EAAISNVAGESSYVRVQVLTPLGVLDRDKQLGVVEELTEIIAAAAGDPSLRVRTWVLLTESPEGGWGIGGHANTNADIAALARASNRRPESERRPPGTIETRPAASADAGPTRGRGGDLNPRSG